MESASPDRAARLTWNANRRNRTAVSRRTYSRMSIPRLGHQDRPVVNLLEHLARAFGGPLFQVDVALRLDLQQDLAIPHPARHALDALFMPAIQIVRQPQDRDNLDRSEEH